MKEEAEAPLGLAVQPKAVEQNR